MQPKFNPHEKTRTKKSQENNLFFHYSDHVRRITLVGCKKEMQPDLNEENLQITEQLFVKPERKPNPFSRAILHAA